MFSAVLRVGSIIDCVLVTLNVYDDDGQYLYIKK